MKRHKFFDCFSEATTLFVVLEDASAAAQPMSSLAERKLSCKCGGIKMEFKLGWIFSSGKEFKKELLKTQLRKFIHNL